MGNLWRVLDWIALFLGAIVAAGAVTFLFARRRIFRHVRAELGHDSLLLAAGAWVGGYSGAVEERGSAAPGVLMLLSTGLYFHSWVGRREVFIPGASISWIGVTDAREASRWERPRIVVRFLNAAGKEDGIAIRLLYPTQWVAAIKTHLITRAL
jgi:hypothetical protein